MARGARLAGMFLLGCISLASPATHAAEYPAVEPGYRLRFPRDDGAHPAFRTEWWYVTGWVRDAAGSEFGFQVTFFRNRPGLQEDNPSAFAPKQLLFAHAAIADPRAGRLRHDQRAAREGFGFAYARENDTDVRIGDWWLRREGDRYLARVTAQDFALELRFDATQPILLQGEAGYSRKGPRPAQASYYYSRPQLAVSGRIAIEGRRLRVTGQAWLDHEWSSEYLAPEAAGWDWTGVNLRDGGALMAFRIRARDGATLWAGGALRDPAGRVRSLSSRDIAFAPLRRWRSPRTDAQYPVAMRLRAGDRVFELQPLLEDQELDARASTGTVYWEGAVRALENGRLAGLGYLELTGYFARPHL